MNKPIFEKDHTEDFSEWEFDVETVQSQWSGASEDALEAACVHGAEVVLNEIKNEAIWFFGAQYSLPDVLIIKLWEDFYMEIPLSHIMKELADEESVKRIVAGGILLDEVERLRRQSKQKTKKKCKADAGVE